MIKKTILAGLTGALVGTVLAVLLITTIEAHKTSDTAHCLVYANDPWSC